MRQWVGSILFTFFLFATVPIYGTVALLTAPLPRACTYAVAVFWVDSMFWLLRVLCRLDYVVEGREHLPARSSIVLLKPIAIDRRGGGVAVQQVLEQGRARLAEGIWVMVFPEGTRMPVRQTRRYGMSGVLLAQAEGLPVVPVTHNAGYFWPRRGWLKKSGTIRLVIGPPIETKGVEPRVVNERAQRWIEDTLATLA